MTPPRLTPLLLTLALLLLAVPADARPLPVDHVLCPDFYPEANVQWCFTTEPGGCLFVSILPGYLHVEGLPVTLPVLVCLP